MPRLNIPPAPFVAAALASLMIPVAGAETIPASVRACTQETDSLKRLICFDREIARYTGQPAATQGGAASPAPLAQSNAASPAPTTVSPAPASMSPSATASTASAPHDAASSPPARDVSAPATPASSRPKHTSARIVSIEPFPDSVVVHLDNNEVWRQIQEASADPNLRVGETVTIDREMGAYWLAGSNGSAIKVRQTK